MIDVIAAAPDMASPSAWVERFVPLIPSGEVLDLACGRGRHTKLLAGQGCQVIAVDRDAAALHGLASNFVSTLCIDLEQGRTQALSDLLQAARFAGIVVTNYLHRPLLPMLLDALCNGGILIYETFAHGNAIFGKPSNPAFLLEPGELLNAVSGARCGMQVVAYEHGFQSAPHPAMVQRLCAIRCDSNPLPAAMIL